MPKKISHSDIIGQQGINIIEEIVLEMGFLWYPSGGVEAGIDGVIEIRDSETGEVTNCIIQVQSKARQKTQLQAETETSFEYRCDERDIDYWLQGNAPVILIIIKISTKEAFWVSTKDYFRDLKRRQSKKVLFDKVRDRFDVGARLSLMHLAIPRNSGLYLAPRPKQEKLYSNLLRVSRLAEHLYTAYTITEDESKAYSILQKIGRDLGQEWLLKENFVLSFHNLREPPWTEICDPGTIEEHDVEEWSLSSRLERQQEFVWLLNKALREKVKIDLSFDPKKKCYYFKPTADKSARQYDYRSLAKKTHRDVFQRYLKKNSEEVAYYRHSAFQGQFLRIESNWFLEITPTYFFSRDGYTRDKFEQEKLSGIKRLEKNSAVFGQLVMWAEYLSTPAQGELFTPIYQFLEFDRLEEFEIDVGINDSIWLGTEDKETTEILEDNLNDLPLFRLKNEN
ncbi:DUF4365 domain-containing protein [Coleofasciculus sp. FACHB-1120]|uniref:DUF4365 domain-containing protein n=1 Tax=Coleofasciculus sp. FACHB-1120 TaxID=2692783 RepID=UPI001686B854|nr:DUF4365 domain-containing protein [Coleofasciculus sp. FACHB-1120]